MPELAFSPIPSGQIPGVITTVVFAFLSTLALLFVAFRWVWLCLRPYGSEASSRESLFFHTQLGLYSVCLLASNLFSSIAGLFEISWVMDKGIQEGVMCTTQAVLMQIGNVATAFFTATIAVHAFNSLVLRNRQSVWIGILVIVAGWIAVVIIAVAPMLVKQPLGPLYGISAFSCGVKRIYAKQQFLFHLLPILLAAFISVTLYSIVFLVIRGTLIFSDGLKVNLNPHQRWNGRIGSRKEYHQFMDTIAKSMLWYPFAYVVLLLPYTVARMVDLSGFTVSPGGNVFAVSCWFLLGLVDVLLLHNTFRVIGPAFDAVSSSSDSQDASMESFGGLEKSYSPSVIVVEDGPTTIPVAPVRIQPPRPLLLASQPTRTRALTPQPPSYVGYGGSTVTAASLQRPIAPMPELNGNFIASPEASLKKGAANVPRLHLQTDQVTSSSLPSSGSVGLPPPPRSTRSKIARRPTLESLPPSTPTQQPTPSTLSPTSDISISPVQVSSTGAFKR